MNSKLSYSAPELSCVVALEKIPAAGLIKVIEANESERQDLAKRFDILEVKKLKAELDVTPARAGQAIKVTGNLTADVVQKCVITLEPLSNHVERDIEILYVTDESGDALPVDPHELETDSVTNGVIDLGELVAQNFGLALDPYPRKPGASLELIQKEEEKPPKGSLAALKDLKISRKE